MRGPGRASLAWPVPGPETHSRVRTAVGKCPRLAGASVALQRARLRAWGRPAPPSVLAAPGDSGARCLREAPRSGTCRDGGPRSRLLFVVHGFDRVIHAQARRCRWALLGRFKPWPVLPPLRALPGSGMLGAGLGLSLRGLRAGSRSTKTRTVRPLSALQLDSDCRSGFD